MGMFIVWIAEENNDISELLVQKHFVYYQEALEFYQFELEKLQQRDIPFNKIYSIRLLKKDGDILKEDYISKSNKWDRPINDNIVN